MGDEDGLALRMLSVTEHGDPLSGVLVAVADRALPEQAVADDFLHARQERRLVGHAARQQDRAGMHSVAIGPGSKSAAISCVDRGDLGLRHGCAELRNLPLQSQ